MGPIKLTFPVERVGSNLASFFWRQKPPCGIAHEDSGKLEAPNQKSRSEKVGVFVERTPSTLSCNQALREYKIK